MVKRHFIPSKKMNFALSSEIRLFSQSAQAGPTEATVLYDMTALSYGDNRQVSMQKLAA